MGLTVKLAKMRILVAEDVPDNLILLQSILEASGHRISVAFDGAQAIELATAQIPDLILMDLSMPIVDGWEATRHIKGQASTSHIPIIALTAHAMPGDRERAFSVGCNDYLTKPIDLEQIERVLAFWSSPARSSSRS
jgi:two-component system, cell cycle response regulator DivK